MQDVDADADADAEIRWYKAKAAWRDLIFWSFTKKWTPSGAISLSR